MSINYERILSSNTFQFIIGPGRRKFTIHTALAAHHSAPLSVLMQGPMREAQNGVAELSDVDEAAFIRFCEYAYTGNYTPAQHSIWLDSSAIDPEPSLPENRTSQLPPDILFEAFDDSFGVSKKDKKKSKSPSFGVGFGGEKSCSYCGVTPGKQILWEEFRRSHYSNSTPNSGPRKNVEECEDYTNVFLCHARVYVLAEKYDIKELCALALHKLQQTLEVFHVYAKRIRDIVNLVRYSYSNENTRDNEVGQDIDGLRKLIVHYVACVFETVASDDSFLVLMEEGGPFIRDLAPMLLKRIG